MIKHMRQRRHLRTRGYRHPYWLWWNEHVAPQWVRDRYAAYRRYRVQYLGYRVSGIASVMGFMRDSDGAVGFITGRE